MSADSTGSTGIARLAEWATNTELDEIPAAIGRRAIMVFLDDTASAVAAHSEPEIVSLTDRLTGGRPEASVLTRPGLKLERSHAAMLNAIAANWCQLDEGHRKVMCHAGLYVVPPAIAEAEAENLNLGQVIRAIVLAYEVVCRFAETWTFPGNAVHPHAIWSPLGAATVLGLLRRLSAADLIAAMTTALTFGQPGPFRHGIQGALVQNVWAGTGVLSGFRTLDFVAAGITGVATSPHDVLSGLLGATAEHNHLTNDLGSKWALTSSYHKLHSCAQQSHAAVEAAIKLKQTWPADQDIADVSRIVVDVHPLALKMDNPKPANTLSARFSIPHIVATALMFGRASADVFTPDILNDHDLAILRDRVELALFEPRLAWPHDRAASINIEFLDGRKIFGECLSAEGGPDRPYSEDQTIEKCASLMGMLYPSFPSNAQALNLAAVDHAQDFPSFLGRLLSMR